MAFVKSISGQVSKSEIAGQATKNALSKAETEIYYLNNCDLELSLGGVFSEVGCDGVLLLQRLTTAYRTRWLTG